MKKIEKLMKDAVSRLNEDTITLDDAASWLGISRRSIFTYIKNGKLDKVKWKGQTRITSKSMMSLLEPLTKHSISLTQQKIDIEKLLTSYGFRYNEDEDTYYASWYDGGTLTTNSTNEWNECGCMLNIEETNFWFHIENYQKFLDIMLMDQMIVMKDGCMPDWDYQDYRNPNN